MDSNELEFPVIRNTSVVDSVKDWITDQMIKGNLRPGSKLPTEAELSQRLGVGRIYQTGGGNLCRGAV